MANYLPAHPELLQADANGRGSGVKAMGEAMFAAAGKDYESMKGMASQVAMRLRLEHATTNRSASSLPQIWMWAGKRAHCIALA